VVVQWRAGEVGGGGKLDDAHRAAALRAAEVDPGFEVV
jgi:hypothetical protein